MLKKYQLLRFLNNEHGFVLRTAFGATGYLGAMLVSQSSMLASDLYYQFKNNQFKTGTRRAAWLLRTFWNINTIEDEIYNFTEDLPESALQVLDKKLAQKIKKDPKNPILLSDQIYVWAALMERDARYFPALKTQFESNATLICQLQSQLPAQQKTVGNEENRRADFDIGQARKALKDFAELISLDEWNWYVVSGTFLGLIREGGFLPHDYDIDIGIHAEEFDLNGFIDQLDRGNNFFVRKVSYQQEYAIKNGHLELISRRVALVKIIHTSNVNVDIFIHHRDNDIRWHGSAYHRWENKEFALKRYAFESIDVNGPADSDLYLTENYGDWRTPVVEFNCSTGTPNLTLINNPSSISLFLRRIAVAKSRAEYNRGMSYLTSGGFFDEENNFALHMANTGSTYAKHG